MPDPHRASDPLEIDALVIGGGVAGLFILDALARRGVGALLCEATALGSSQTTASQGILHAGMKYSLGGLVGDDAQEAARAAELWQSMLAGNGGDLRGVRVLSRECYLWRSSGLVAAASLAAARVGLRTRPESVAAPDRPAWLKGVSGDVLRLPETVIDPISLVGELSNRHAERLARGTVAAITVTEDAVTVAFSSAALPQVRARHVILAAGAGNESLASMAGIVEPMQRRPLRQALLRGDLPLVFGHCIDGARTRVTITSDTLGEDRVWQVGGEVAEAGASMAPAEFERVVRSELAEVLPSGVFGPCSFASYLVDRAEPHTPSGRRPPRAHSAAHGALRVVWPVKLVLAPFVAEEIAHAMPTPEHPGAEWPAAIMRPALARRPWDDISWGARA